MVSAATIDFPFPMDNFYKILGVLPSASESQIKSAYRKLSKKFHPDLNPNDSFFEERFKELQAAYEILINPESRKEYDILFKASDFTNSPKTNPSENRGPASGPDINPIDPNEKKKRRRFPSIEILAFFLLAIVVTLFRTFVNQQISKDAESDFRNYETAKADSSNHADSAMMTPDTAKKTPSQIDSGLKRLDPFAGIILNVKNELIPICNFPKNLDTTFDPAPRKSFQDLDNDGIPELLITYWSGGAHCCDITSIYKNEDRNVYKRVFEFSGNLQISSGGISTVELICSFYEDIGYFFSCYACSIEDQVPTRDFAPVIYFSYEKGKFVLPKHQFLNDEIIKDLTFLSGRNVPPLDTDQFDDGTRKAYAARIISYYFNNDMNLEETRSLFDKYYINEDQSAIWKEIVERIKWMRKTNFFNLGGA